MKRPITRTDPPRKIILYGRPTCGTSRYTRRLLEQANVDFEYIDIRQDEQARERVREINQGFESVPTLVFPDGSTLTEPSTRRLRLKLASLGYKI